MKTETLHLVVCMKPLEGTFAQNAIEQGVAGFNVDGCRVSTDDKLVVNVLEEWSGFGQKKRPKYAQTQNTTGRFPANVIHDGSVGVLAGFPKTKSGIMKGNTRRAAQDLPGSVCYGVFGGYATVNDTIGDSGSAARFFWSFDED